MSTTTKRKLEPKKNNSPKRKKEEEFAFKDGAEVFQFDHTPSGYKCWNCKTAFKQIGGHIKKSECGQLLNREKFQIELRKYQKNTSNQKGREKKTPEEIKSRSQMDFKNCRKTKTPEEIRSRKQMDSKNWREKKKG